MRIPSLLLAALAALALPAEAAPQPAAVPPAAVPPAAATTPTPITVMPDITAEAPPPTTPPPQLPPLPQRLHGYRELLKRSEPALPKNAADGADGQPCPVDCNNGFCCPTGRVCRTLEARNNQHPSVVCAHPELRKRQSLDFDNILGSTTSDIFGTAWLASFSEALAGLDTLATTNTDDWWASLSSELDLITSGVNLGALTTNANDRAYLSWLSSLTNRATATGNRNPFNTDPASYSDSTTSSSSRRRKKTSLGTIVGGAVGGILVLAIIAGVVVLIVRRRKPAPVQPAPVTAGPVPPKPDPSQPEKPYYQPAMPGTVEADGMGNQLPQQIPPQYSGYQQQPQQYQVPPQYSGQPQPNAPPQQQQQQPQQGAVYQHQQQQPQQGAVYHEMPQSPPPPQVSPIPPGGYQPYPPPPPPPVQSPPPAGVYHEMDIGPARQ